MPAQLPHPSLKASRGPLVSTTVIRSLAKVDSKQAPLPCQGLEAQVVFTVDKQDKDIFEARAKFRVRVGGGGEEEGRARRKGRGSLTFDLGPGSRLCTLFLLGGSSSFPHSQ